MGGRAVTCLNLVMFPPDALPPETLHGIIEGALEKIVESGAVLAGGHTIEDEEPKFGLSVTGIVHPEKYWANRGAKEGDVLILTKPIGSGVLLNANLKNWVSDDAMAKCYEHLRTLNRKSSEIMQKYEIHSATDITGFGLAGHALEIAQASGVGMVVDSDNLLIMDEALKMYEKGMTTAVNEVNYQAVKDFMTIEKKMPEIHESIFIDPQTNGGLFACVPENQAEELVKELQGEGIEDARIIGRTTSENKGRIIFQ